MIIIIEGSDGSGKTTLAQQLSRQTGFPIVHQSYPKTEEEKKCMVGMYIQAIKENKNAIFDRCWYSEMVYGPILRDRSAISYIDMYKLEEQVAKVGGMIIHCTGPESALWMRCTKRGEDYVTSRDDFKAIHKGFNDIMNIPHYLPVVQYEYKEV